MSLINKIIGSYSERQVKKIEPICKQVDALEEKIFCDERERTAEYDADIKRKTCKRGNAQRYSA